MKNMSSNELDAKQVYDHALINGRQKDREYIILLNVRYTYWYANNVIGEQWPEGESNILSDPCYSYLYAKYVIKGQWPAATDIINSHCGYKKMHKDFIESL